MATDRSWRPFWLHQAAEYLVALVLIASSLQSPDPLWPALAGGLVLVNAALSGPPLGAFRVVGRPLHRRLDLVVVGVLVVVAALPLLTIDAASRLTMLVVAVVLGFVWWGTNFATSAERRRRLASSTSGRVDAQSIGRTAGRLVAKAGDAMRKRPWTSVSACTPAEGLHAYAERSEPLPGGFAGVGLAVVVGQLQPLRGGLVDDDADVRVELQRRGREERRHRTLHGPGDGVRLGLAGGDEDEVAGVEDRADSLGEDVVRHGVDRVEESGVVEAGLRGQRLQPRSRRQRRARLVEPDVPVAADAEQLQVDPAGVADRRLVGGAGAGKVGRPTVRPVHPPRIEVDAAGELPLDHRPVRLRVVGGQPDVLVEQERRGGGERQPSAVRGGG